MILIYSVYPDSQHIIAVADISKRDEVEREIARRNAEAEDAEIVRRFKYSIEAVEHWFAK